MPSSAPAGVLRSHDPYRNETFAEHPALTEREALEAAARSGEAQRAWATVPLGKRLSRLRDLAEVLKRNREDWARLATREMGKPLAQALSEIDKCVWLCRYYAEHAAGFLAPRDVEADAEGAWVRQDPLGVVLAVMPWNFPFWQVFRCAVPATTAGNAVLLKHASNVPGCALACERAFAEAGYPDGVFRTLLVGSGAVAGLVAHEAVRAVSLTGSEAAGAAVAEAAGRALKPCVLELGGSDPFLVLDDADLDRAAATAVTARMINNGQSCIAAKRFIVDRAVGEAFRERLLARLAELKAGDPLQEGVDLGPLARPAFAEGLEAQVARSLEAGARRVFKGSVPRRKGFFPPTVLDGVRPGMPAFDEELFGPVFALVDADGPEEALALANASAFGLGASVWTADRARAERLAARLEVGTVALNALVASDPRLPFGGVKRSGYGRELAREGLVAFTNTKSVVWHG
jgi:acyl-CoA reductase-like NAD-dependent aldehyde dehydrogenase